MISGMRLASAEVEVEHGVRYGVEVEHVALVVLLPGDEAHTRVVWLAFESAVHLLGFVRPAVHPGNVQYL